MQTHSNTPELAEGPHGAGYAGYAGYPAGAAELAGGPGAGWR